VLSPIAGHHHNPQTLLVCVVLLVVFASPAAMAFDEQKPATIPSAVPTPQLQVVGVEVHVADLDRAIPFYTGTCGFELVRRYERSAELRSGSVVLRLEQVARAAQIDYPREVETHMNFQVMNLDTFVREAKRQNVEVLGNSPQRTAIGSSTTVRDPSGNILHFMQLDSPSPSLAKPAVLNVGIKVTEMAEAKDFYTRTLGFEIYSEDYYPPTIPLKRSGMVALTLHDNASTKARVGYPEVAQTIVVVGTPDLDARIKELKGKGVEFLEEPRGTAGGRQAAFKDPFGNVLKLVEMLAIATGG
jgi:catechol 2,3-dioxygenase-like lactoylglutathione lyase family enzyme